MKLTYEIILRILSSRYTLVEGKEKNYFVDNSNNFKKVVATVDENTIVMYMYCDSEEIWNHHNTVMIVFSKDARDMENQILIKGVCGTGIDCRLNNDCNLESYCNNELWDSIKRHTYSFGSCGNINHCWKSLTSFEICGIVSVSDCRLYEDTNSVDELASHRKIKFIRKPDYIYPDALLNRMKKIYESHNKSLSSIRLQMLYEAKAELGTLEEAKEFVSSRYDFNIRKCDKSLVKRNLR